MPAGRHVERGHQLRVRAGVVDLHLVALDAQRHTDAHRIAAGLILVGIVGKEVFAIGQVADDRARLRLGIIEQSIQPLTETIGPEAGDDILHLAHADLGAGDLRQQVAVVLFGQAHVGFDQRQKILVHLPVAHQPHRRDAQTFLVDFGQGSRQRSGHGAAHVGVVDVVADEADQFPLVEHRPPHVQVRRMGGDKAGIGVGHHAYVAVSVIEPAQNARIVEAGVPGRAHRDGRGDGQSLGREDLAGEILGLLHEGRMRGAHQRVAHALGRGGAEIGENLEFGGGAGGHAHSPSVMRRLAKRSTRTAKPGGTTVVLSS